MKNPSHERPVTNVVLAAKKFVIFFGVLLLPAAVSVALSGPIEALFAGIGIAFLGVFLFIVGGLIAGLAKITQAAEVYIEKEIEQWEQEQARAKAEQEQAEDEVIDYLVDMVK